MTNTGLFLEILLRRRALLKRDHWTRNALVAHQTRALQELRNFAYRYSPFYQRFHKGLEKAPLHEFPIITKSILMENYDEILTDRTVTLQSLTEYINKGGAEERFDEKYWVAATSGTTGKRGIFLWNREEWTTVLASFARANEWGGVTANLFHRMKLAVVSSRTAYHQSARAGVTLQSWWVPTLRLDANQPLGDIVSQLNAFQPRALVGYASMIHVLAEEQLAGRLNILPGAVFSASEVLTPQIRALVSRAWKRDVFNEYAGTETASIAAECSEHSGLHLFEDLIIPEIVDEEGKPCEPDKLGERLLVSVLFSRTLPLIRYEMSDSLRLSSRQCTCGRPFRLIADIEGRAEDVLALAGKNGIVRVHPVLFHQLLDPIPGAGWQIVQEADGLRVLLASSVLNPTNAMIQQSIETRLLDLGAEIRIFVERVPSIQRTKMGKAPFIVAMRKLSV